MAADEGLTLAGRYRMGPVIGRGGMAVVHRAQDLRVDGPVAVKVLLPHLVHVPAVVARFRQEAIAAKVVDHPAVVRIRELIDTPEGPALVMDYFEGRELKSLIRTQGPLAVADAVRVARIVAQALDAAHRHGVIHRDVKPQNILMGEDGSVRLIDFGMARLGTLAGLTTQSLVLATPEYAPPELFGHGPADPRSDLYSLGATLYEALTGKLPHRGRSPIELLERKTSTRVLLPSSERRGVPEWLDRVVAMAMAVAPEDRYSSAAQMSRALESEGQGQAISRAELVSCRSCEGPIHPSIEICPWCHRETSEVIEQRPRERHAVMVSRKYRPTWFGGAGIGNPDSLTYEQKASVVAVTEGATRRKVRDVGKIDRRLRQPPFVVLDHLGVKEAEKLKRMLAQRGVEARIRRRTMLTPILELAFRFEGAAFLLFAAFLGMALTATSVAAGATTFAVLSVLGYLLEFGRLRPLIRFEPRTSRQLTGDATPGWLEAPLRAFSRGVRTTAHRRQLMRSYSAALQLEQSVERFTALSPTHATLLRDRISECLTRAGDLSRAIEEIDTRMEATDEATILEEISQADEKLARLTGTEASEALIELKVRKLEQLSTRREAESRRDALFAELLTLDAALYQLEAELAGTDGVGGMLERAVDELDAEIKGIVAVTKMTTSTGG
ncbi:MAG: protein kinase [Deltaproteobacteria bacterium]|nr:protein kinase [Deltaproteobacteria bacterium]